MERFFFIALMLSSQVLLGQNIPSFSKQSDLINLVPNPGFEELKKEPCSWTTGKKQFYNTIMHWDMPTETHPDIYSKTAGSTCFSNPKKINGGQQMPRTGNGMLGLKVFGTGGTETYWHEYIQVKLTEPLEKGKKYQLEYWVLRNVKSQNASGNIGAVFSKESIQSDNRFPLYITPLVNHKEVVQTKVNRWKKIRGVFVADSAYSYLTIGNFYSDEQTKNLHLGRGKNGAYYFIDDVLLALAPENAKLSPKPAPSEKPSPLKEIEVKTSTQENDLYEVKLEVGKTIELSNLFFETGKANLLPASEQELDRLAHILYDYPKMVIEIHGHTDNVGSEALNQNLSEARAKAVVDFLISRKTDPKRLSYVGHGSKAPVASNQSDDGRQRNRRVEFKIVQ